MDIWEELKKLNEEKETGFIKAEQVGKARTGGSSNVQKTKQFLVEGFIKLCTQNGKVVKNWFNVPYTTLIQQTANDPKVAINNKYFINTIKRNFTIYNSDYSETAKKHIKTIEHEINSKLQNVTVTLKNIHFRKQQNMVKIIYDIEIKTLNNKQEQKSEQKSQTQNKTQNIKPQK